MAGSRILFAFVVALCLAQVGWWTYFQFQEARHLEQAARLLQAGETAAAARVLGSDDPGGLAEEARRRRNMFVSEGIALTVLVLVGVVLFYLGMLRERRLREGQERFLTGATHELKTPVATLRLGLESLQDARTPQERRDRYLQAMLQEVDRLEKGVTNVLMAAALHADERHATRSEGDLAADVREALEAFRPRFQAANLELAAPVLEPVRAQRDPVAMRLILNNLLDNALKYTPAQGRIEVSLRAEGREAVLRVTDTGLGLDAEELKRAFQRFYRGTAREHAGGVGLGLFLVRELAEMHGGRVEARSAGRGRGAEFEVRLPAA
ncbi:MAG: HAMP domain-containing histidine kinase [Planctomycetes bacterium]|nr:HAMP domain-containing histidine kinase [Planctomycetota bacterium]